MIGIVDYGMGNLRSVQKALQRVGGDARIIQTASELAAAKKIVLPGVGAFGDAMDRLRSNRLDGAIVRAIADGRPFLGICLGFQMLFDVSYEDGQHTGLGVFPGKVVRFDFSGVSAQPLRVPQIGWNQIQWERLCPMLTGVDNGAYVYFCHSYYVVPMDAQIAATTTDYGHCYVSSVWKDNVFATQFHPEKSQAVGLKILENFVRL